MVKSIRVKCAKCYGTNKGAYDEPCGSCNNGTHVTTVIMDRLESRENEKVKKMLMV
jgi:hypothetical protein